MIIKMRSEVKEKILRSVGCCDAESGGVIARNPDDMIVDFYFDWEAGSGNISYVPSRDAINSQVNNRWQPLGYRFAGIVHSHPPAASREPSAADVRMAEKIIRCNRLKKIILIIVQADALSVWSVSDDNRLESCELTTI